MNIILSLSGVSISRPFVDSYNLTNDTCPYGSLLGVSFKGVGDVCPKGYYCNRGSWKPQLCEAGSFNNEIGQKKCKFCPAGFYCPQGTLSYLNNFCPAGHYCPENTTRSNEYPCPEGTYNSMNTQTSLAACLPCAKGKYCAGVGNANFTGDCQKGWYCNESSISATPNINGGQCKAGYYCPVGSYEPIPCELGAYCDRNGLDTWQGNCYAGYYCNQMSTNPQPNGTEGGSCPYGKYCTEGTKAPENCPPRTFLDVLGGRKISDCKVCTSGKFCNQSGLAFPSGDCEPGYYCPNGSISNREVACDYGHFCTGGKGIPEPCPSGQYQNEKGQSACKTCVERYFCSATYGPVVNFESFICPEGHFCPSGTRFAAEYPCQLGTFSNSTGRANQNECLPCLGGFYCGSNGLTEPITPCSAGYFCKSGAKTATPREGENANICPIGFYCPTKTENPIGCTYGTIGLKEGLMSQTECSNCPPGMFCDMIGKSNYSGQCNQSFYCPGRSNNSQQISCPEGFYCPTGSAFPTPCPAGTYSNTQHLFNLTQCRLCDEGKYCNNTGLTAPSGLCKEGYFCPMGSSSEMEEVCPVGFYCPQGKLFLMYLLFSFTIIALFICT